MAERRMFSRRIVNSARFLKMPVSSQNLYFHLGLNADDDGVVEAYSVVNAVGATEDDMRILVAKEFVYVLNNDMVTYIMDWKENNHIRADRKIDSFYKDLLLQVLPDTSLIEKRERADVKKIVSKGVDVQRTTKGQPTDGIGKVRLGKVSKEKKEIKKEKNIFFDIANEYTNSASVLEALGKYVEMRLADTKSKFTENALRLALSKLDRFAADVSDKDRYKIECLNESVMNGWKGLFALKEFVDRGTTETVTIEWVDFTEVKDWGTMLDTLDMS